MVLNMNEHRPIRTSVQTHQPFRVRYDSPATVSTFEEGSEKARLVLMRIPIDKETFATGRITPELYDAF